MNHKSNTRTNYKIRKISINEKSKQIKKNNTSFFGKLFGKLSIFGFSDRNRTKMIKDKNNEILKKIGNTNENVNNIENKEISPDNANTIFSFYSRENKKNANNEEFLDVLKTVENTINGNLSSQKTETKGEKIKHSIINLINNSKSFISTTGNNKSNHETINNENSNNNIIEISSDSDNENISNTENEISHQTDYTINIDNSEITENSNNDKKDNKNKEVFPNKSNVFRFWRSSTNTLDSDDENASSKFDKDNNLNTGNSSVASSVVTSSTEIISPNRVLLSESYYQSKQPRKFNSLSNLYFKNSNKQLTKYFSDVNLKYDQKSSYDAYKSVASKYLNRKPSTTTTDNNKYKDLLSNTKEVYRPSSFVIPKKEDKTKKKLKNTDLDDKWIENIREKIEHSLNLNNEKFKEPPKDYYEELKRISKLIEEEAKKKANKNFPELSEEAYYRINDAIGPGNEQEVLNEEFNIPIKRHDIRTLIDGKWLNDEIINFYGNLIMERSKGFKNKYPPVYFFNTFFFSTLCELGYRGVRRWTRRFDLFNYEYIIIPIHLGNHWVCSAINFKKKRFEYYDSLHGGQRNALHILRNYIQEESKDKKKCEYDLSDWEDYCPKDIPSQLNGYDCGVFTLLFAEYISREEEFDFEQSHIQYVRNRIIYEILNSQLLIK